MNYLLIGSSAACVSAAHTLARHNASAQITLVTEQLLLPSNTCAIKYVLDGSKKKESIFLPLPPRTVLHTQQRIIDINPYKKFVTADTGKQFFYQKLIIGIGTKPYVPDIYKPYLGNGVFTYHTLDDVESLISFMDNKNKNGLRAIVIGAGLSGIEASIALRTRGLCVTLIEKNNVIVAHEDDKTQHAMVSLLAEHAIDTYCSTDVLTFNAINELFVLQTTQGIHTADIILLAAGCVADNQWLLPVCDLDTRGYITRVYQRYACDITIIGDCLSMPRVRNGWARAIMQGKQIIMY